MTCRKGRAMSRVEKTGPLSPYSGNTTIAAPWERTCAANVCRAKGATFGVKRESGEAGGCIPTAIDQPTRTASRLASKMACAPAGVKFAGAVAVAAWGSRAEGRRRGHEGSRRGVASWVPPRRTDERAVLDHRCRIHHRPSQAAAKNGGGDGERERHGARRKWGRHFFVSASQWRQQAAVAAAARRWRTWLRRTWSSTARCSTSRSTRRWTWWPRGSCRVASSCAFVRLRVSRIALAPGR